MKIFICCMAVALFTAGCKTSYDFQTEMERNEIRAANLEKAKTEEYQQNLDNNRRSEFIRNNSKQSNIRRY